VVSGTTGESPTLSREEKPRLFAEIELAIADRGVVVAGTGNYNTRESQELTKEAEKIGVDAYLLVVPYYNRPTQQGLWEHCKAIAQSTTLPCIIYNVPSRTVTNLSADRLIKLSQTNNSVGVKEASGNFGQITEIIQGTRQDFLVYQWQ
jgi:4-hydroxy-tetrahydrodipicolinate synthase